MAIFFDFFPKIFLDEADNSSLDMTIMAISGVEGLFEHSGEGMEPSVGFSDRIETLLDGRLGFVVVIIFGEVIGENKVSVASVIDSFSFIHVLSVITLELPAFIQRSSVDIGINLSFSGV